MEYSYVMCEGKIRKSINTYNYEQIKELGCDWARILPSGLVMFDVDDVFRGELLLKVLKNNDYHRPLKFSWVKTTKGYHFIFRTDEKQVRNLNKKYNWLGIELDIKGAGLDEIDKISYESMRVDGVLRQEVYWNGERDNEDDFGNRLLEDDKLDIAPKWLYHLPPELVNISEKSKLYTLTKVLRVNDDEEDKLIGDRNGFYFGNYMICMKQSGLSYADYLEAVNIVNFIVADFKGSDSWHGIRSLSRDELLSCTREDAWDGIEVRDDEIKALLALAEDLYISLAAIVDRDTGVLKIIDYTDNFKYYMVNDAHIEELLKTEYKGVKALTPQKEQDVIRFIYEIAKGRRDETGERISYRESDKEWYACKDDKTLVRGRDVRAMTREVYTNLIYNLRSMKRRDVE